MMKCWFCVSWMPKIKHNYTSRQTQTHAYTEIPSSVPCKLKPDLEHASNNQSRPTEYSEIKTKTPVTVDLTSLGKGIGGDDIDDYWIKIKRIRNSESLRI